MRSVCGAGRQGGCSRLALTPSLPARAQGHGRTSVSPPGVVVAVEEGEQHAPPLSSTRAVYPWRTARSLPLKAATDAVETADGHEVVLLVTPEQLLRKRDRCFRFPVGCPACLAPLGKCAALLHAALRETARAPPAARDKTTKSSRGQAHGSPSPALCALQQALVPARHMPPRCTLRGLTQRVCARLRSHQLTLRPSSGHAVHAARWPCVQQQALTTGRWCSLATRFPLALLPNKSTAERS